MQETRRARLQAVIQEELSVVVPRALKDPRIPVLTFNSVEVAQDGSHATVWVSILGASQALDAASSLGEAEQERVRRDSRKRMDDCLTGLASASGFLRRHLAKVLTVRHVPTLAFKEDRGQENAYRVQELLRQLSTVEPPRPSTHLTVGTPATGTPSGSRDPESGSPAGQGQAG